MGRSRKQPSVEPFEVDISRLDAKGLGVALHADRKVSVFDALPGEKILARNLVGRSNRGRAETLEVLQASKDRVEPRCPVFGYCGGCSLQHMSMAAQLERKQTALLQALRAAGILARAALGV